MNKLLLLLILFFSISCFGQKDPDTYSNRENVYPIVISDTAEVFEAPSRAYESFLELDNGQFVNLLEKGHKNGWYKIWIEGKTGYIHGDDIAFGFNSIESRIDKYQKFIDTSVGTGRLWYYYLPSSVTKVFGSIELWVRAEPQFPEFYKKEKKLPSDYSYHLIHMEFTCMTKRMTASNYIFYNTAGKEIKIPDFIGTFYEPVAPDTIGEKMLMTACKMTN